MNKTRRKHIYSRKFLINFEHQILQKMCWTSAEDASMLVRRPQKWRLVSPASRKISHKQEKLALILGSRFQTFFFEGFYIRPPPQWYQRNYAGARRGQVRDSFEWADRLATQLAVQWTPQSTVRPASRSVLLIFLNAEFFTLENVIE